MKPPPIKVEIVHIDGPLKGTIQEFYEPVITLGRHPGCQVVFPRELTSISRHHLELRRDGNRFQAVDQSTNGTLLNGKPIEQSFLKNGDILTLGENGPKLSVLTSIISADEVVPEPPSRALEDPPAPPRRQPKPERGLTAAPTDDATPAPPVRDHISPPHRPPTEKHPHEPAEDRSVTSARQPFVIQFGAMIKSYNTLPITLGSGADCDFVIAHRAVLSHHAQIYYAGQQYYIKDLTGRGLVAINGTPVNDGAAMPPDTCISLSGQGPMFQFIGAGRLAEIENCVADSPGHDSAGASPADGGNVKKKGFWSFGKK